MARNEIRSDGFLQSLAKRPVRAEVMTEVHEPPESHWRAVHLRMVKRRLLAQNIDTWVTVTNSDPGVYVGLSFSCQELPLLKGPHITIGQFSLVKRVNMTSLVKRLEWHVQRHASHKELAFELAPYGRGFNWELEAATDMYWLRRDLREECSGLMEGKWLPAFHVTWH